MNKVYDNGEMVLGKVINLKHYIKHNEYYEEDDEELMGILNDLEDLNDDDIACVNYSNGMGYTIDYWQNNDYIRNYDEDNNFSKVEQFYNKNQFVIRDNKKIIFQSYNSTIAIYDIERDCLTLGENWDFSNTTRKHLYSFIEEEVNPLTNNKINLYRKDNKRKYIEKLIEESVIELNKEIW